jgi:hypothetical protein
MHKLEDVPGKRDIATRRELADTAAQPTETTGPHGSTATIAPELTSVAQDYLKVIWTAQELPPSPRQFVSSPIKAWSNTLGTVPSRSPNTGAAPLSPWCADIG